MRVVGQCKKYTSPVQVSAVKEFIETLEDVKHRGEPKIEGQTPSWFHATRGPIVGLFVAHSGFQSGAETKARNHGIIAADSLDLAEIMAASERIPEDITLGARADVCADKVRAALQSLVAAPP